MLLAAALGLLPAPAHAFGLAPYFTTDSTRTRLDVGVGSDLTNTIFYEQTFDSTAFTGRTTVSDAAVRVLGLGVAGVDTRRGAWFLSAANELRAGNTLVRDWAQAAVGRVLAPGTRLALDGEHDWRRDTSFDQRREDRRAAGRLALSWSDPQRGLGARAYVRAERQRSAEGSFRLYPDYDFRQAGLDVDRIGLAGPTVALSYAYARRAFPDTAARNYHEHTLGAWAMARVGDRLTLDLRGDGARRRAVRDSAVGDRFWQGDAELRATVRLAERWEAGLRARLRGARYDAPTPAFFNGVVYRYAAFARLRPTFESAWELRPVAEFARTPGFGGLPADASPEDRLAVANEEYDQWGVECEAERLAPGRFASLTVGGGRRSYFERLQDEATLSTRSDFWYGELSGFLDRPLGPRVVLRLSADAWAEFHDLSSDDLTSLFLTLELRLPLGARP